MHWQTGRYRLDLTSPRVMGIVNITPDSFSAGGDAMLDIRAALDPRAALDRCERLLREGADILDLGAESTRPGAVPVSVEEELARLLPVLRGAVTLGCPVSVDTQKPEVMRQALAEGADIINDIRALQAPGALDVVAAHPSCGVCLMHMQGTPGTMQQHPSYDRDVVVEVREFLAARLAASIAAGIAADRIVLDPGIGFGKGIHHNLGLLLQQAELLSLARPLLVGWSRKSTLGALTGREHPADRLAASLAAALASVQRGAKIIRVHDVAATVDALTVWQAAGMTAG